MIGAGEKIVGTMGDTISDDTAAAEPLDKKTEAMFLSLMDQYRTRGIRARDAFLYDQQVFERELNARLTKVDELEVMSGIDDSGVRKEYTDYLGHRITVYVLEGYPFEMLMTAIYGTSSESGFVAKTLAEARLNKPELWMKSRDEAVVEAGSHYGQKGVCSDTISCSYRDSSAHFDTFLGEGKLWYCFDHVAANSVKVTAEMDGNVQGLTPDSFDIPMQLRHETWRQKVGAGALPPYKSENRIDVKRVDNFPTHAYNYDKYSLALYNEVAMARYDEMGNPIEPDYIASDSATVGSISEIQKKHAAFFDVPIVLVDVWRYEYPMSEKEKKDFIADYEEQIADGISQVDSVIEKEVNTIKELLNNLSSKDYDKWSEAERVDNPEIYSLVRKKKIIEVSPENEDDKKNRIGDYEDRLQEIIQRGLDELNRSLERRHCYERYIKNRLRSFGEFCDKLIAAPRSEWSKEQVEACKAELTESERFMEIARDLDLLKRATPLNEEDKKARLDAISDEIKKQIAREVSNSERALHILAETAPEEWSTEDKEREGELYSCSSMLYSQKKIYTKLTEGRDGAPAMDSRPIID